MRRGKLSLGVLLASVSASLAHAPAPLNGVTIAPHPLQNYMPVTDAALKAPDPADWIMTRGNSGLGLQHPEPDRQD